MVSAYSCDNILPLVQGSAIVEEKSVFLETSLILESRESPEFEQTSLPHSDSEAGLRVGPHSYMILKYVETRYKLRCRNLHRCLQSEKALILNYSMSLPRIACFHGGGSNARIHMVQCRNLQRELEDEFEFFYFEAPFTRDPGPDILPAFKSYGPYKTWFAGAEDTDGFDHSTGEDGIQRVWNMMIAETGNNGEEWNWVGALGFSQGTRVVSGLLLDQQRRQSQQDLLMSQGIGSLVFGILCMGSGSPMQPTAGSGELLLLKCTATYDEGVNILTSSVWLSAFLITTMSVYHLRRYMFTD